MPNMSLSRFGGVMVACAAVVALTVPAAAVAAPAAPPTFSEVRQQGTLTWRLVRVPNPTADQQRAYDLITRAMNAAVGRYNNLSGLTKSITAYYDPGVPTADGNINGTIRFGNTGYMTERTALHEIGHTIGIGTSGKWRSLGCGGTWKGAQATALVRQYNGQSAVISCDGQHFWPYGLNFENEFSQTNADRHIKIVEAMVRDGL